MNVSKVAKKGLLYTQTGTPYDASPDVGREQPYDATLTAAGHSRSHRAVEVPLFLDGGASFSRRGETVLVEALPAAPGGTTEAALNVMQAENLSHIVDRALLAAKQRAATLATEFGSKT